MTLKLKLTIQVNELAYHCFIFRVEGLEDLRSRMSVDTGLVVVGSADDQLRMTKTKKRMEGITQNMVDRCILVSLACTMSLKCEVSVKGKFIEIFLFFLP